MTEESTDRHALPHALVTNLAVNVRGRAAHDRDAVERTLATLKPAAGAGG